MRKLLIAAVLVLFSVGAHAQEYTPPIPTMPTVAARPPIIRPVRDLPDWGASGVVWGC